MNKEEITRKSIFMTGFRSKLTYPFSFEDLEEVGGIIDFYEEKVNQLEEKEELHLNRIDELTDRIVKSQEKVNQLKKDKLCLANKLNQLETNWNNFKQFLEDNWKKTQDVWFVKLINKMQELERGKE